jgi:DNA-binding CsgD family transcriptional regulator
MTEARTISIALHHSLQIPEPKNLRVLGLTCRESEVMHWIIQGKRNGEIAIILGTKAKTISKHLERIFHKLAVETRTAAALVVLKTMRTVA